MRLTKDADKLICMIYADYKKKRADGMSKEKAKRIGSSKSVQQSIVPKWSFEDVDDTFRELDRAGMLHCFYADNVVYSASITDECIIKMENRFPDGLASILDFVSKFL